MKNVLSKHCAIFLVSFSQFERHLSQYLLYPPASASQIPIGVVGLGVGVALVTGLLVVGVGWGKPKSCSTQ
jgi:hypothetical protein